MKKGKVSVAIESIVISDRSRFLGRWTEIDERVYETSVQRLENGGHPREEGVQFAKVQSMDDAR